MMNYLFLHVLLEKVVFRKNAVFNSYSLCYSVSADPFLSQMR